MHHLVNKLKATNACTFQWVNCMVSECSLSKSREGTGPSQVSSLEALGPSFFCWETSLSLHTPRHHHPSILCLRRSFHLSYTLEEPKCPIEVFPEVMKSFFLRSFLEECTSGPVVRKLWGLLRPLTESRWSPVAPLLRLPAHVRIMRQW